MTAPTFWLSFHAPYACRQSGVCCSSGWDIAIEKARLPAIERAIARGDVHVPAQWLRPAHDAPDDVAGVLAVTDHHCVFHCSGGASAFAEATADRLAPPTVSGCAVQHALGHRALPSACQHFPRVVLRDRRGAFVTLSHYCPTAASLLFDASGAVSVVEGAATLPGGERLEGLDACDALPPLRSPRLLMDWDGYDRWERRSVALLARASSVNEALDALEAEAREPGGASPQAPSESALYAIARQAVPSPYSWPAFVEPRSIENPGGVVGRYLAAHLFASWMAYQGNGLLTTVMYLRVVLTVLCVEAARGDSLFDAVRRSDLLLRHLVDPQQLARDLSAIAAR